MQQCPTTWISTISTLIAPLVIYLLQNNFVFGFWTVLLRSFLKCVLQMCKTDQSNLYGLLQTYLQKKIRRPLKLGSGLNFSLYQFKGCKMSLTLDKMPWAWLFTYKNIILEARKLCPQLFHQLWCFHVVWVINHLSSVLEGLIQKFVNVGLYSWWQMLFLLTRGKHFLINEISQDRFGYKALSGIWKNDIHVILLCLAVLINLDKQG